ncbi:hypothetical protein HispidOSU_020809 [Sigmodon hispidus]
MLTKNQVWRQDQGPRNKDHEPGTRIQKLEIKDQGPNREVTRSREQVEETKNKGPVTGDHDLETVFQGPEIRVQNKGLWTRQRKMTRDKTQVSNQKMIEDQGPETRVHTNVSRN